MEINEDYSAAAHSFFALARVLMCHHPVIGAAIIARRFGEFVPYRSGWNVQPGMRGDRYVWIDPDGKEQDGRTTSDRPEGVPDSEIYRRPPEPPYKGSRAESSFNRAVSALAVQLAEDKRQSEIFRIHHDVQQAAQVDLGSLDDWFAQIVRSMNGRLRDALGQPPFSLSTLTDPATDLIRSYLGFSVPGNVARDVLASYLVFLIDLFPSPSVNLEPPDLRTRAAFEARRIDRMVSLFFHLREKTAGLLTERAGYSLGSFYEMTYLASLFGDISLMIGRTLLDRVRVAGDLRKQIKRTQKVLDEEVTYSTVPTFLYPALFCEFVVPGELKILRKTPFPEPFTYPQLLGTDSEPDEPMNVFRMLHEKTAGLPGFDAIAWLEKSDTLLDKENIDELTESLLFLTLGGLE